MALSDLAVFSRYAYTTMTEVQDQAIDKFNGATRGGLVLTAGNNQGDYDDEIIWAKIQNLVKRRNAYGSGSLTKKHLTMLIDTSVKVAAGIYPVEIDPGMLKWIKKSPKEAGAVIGKQMAEDRVADMLNTAIMAFVAAVGNVPALVNDISSANTTVADTNMASLRALNKTAAKMGDRQGIIKTWLMHSTTLSDIYDTTLANKERLFNFGNVQIMDDGFGRTLVMTDSPHLLVADPAGNSSKADQQYILGLVPGAVMVETNNDEFTDNIETKNGEENIERTYQAEWTYNLGVKGFSWDKTAGGKSPDDAKLGAAANWDKYVTSHKDAAGVILICN